MARGQKNEFVNEWQSFEKFAEEELWRLAKLYVQDEEQIHQPSTMWTVAHGEKYVSFAEKLKQKQELKRSMKNYKPQFSCDSKTASIIDKLIKKIEGLDIELNFPHEQIAFNVEYEQFIPDSYKYFIDRTNGVSLCLVEVFSAQELNVVEDVQEYLDGYGKNYKATDWIFFADDGMGGYYAFRKVKHDEKVYYFDHELPEKLVTFNSFEVWLKEQVRNCAD